MAIFRYNASSSSVRPSNIVRMSLGVLATNVTVVSRFATGSTGGVAAQD